MTVYAVLDARGELVRAERFPEKAQRFAAAGYTVHELVAQQQPDGTLYAETDSGVLRIASGVKSWTPKTATKNSKKSVDD
ncbi:MAG: hypothetical protein ONA90_07515 [candidate division KSB1 bacterium]|nr:hypothetical protein [candidate division KSB1 bacterium]